MFAFGHLTLEAGYWNLFWPQFWQGVSLGLLFVPLTTITMDAISRPAMGNATSIFNLTRNVGGSVGIAICRRCWRAIGRCTANMLGEHDHRSRNAASARPSKPCATPSWPHGGDATTAIAEGLGGDLGRWWSGRRRCSPSSTSSASSA